MIEMKAFEDLLKAIMPHVNAIVDTLGDDNPNESIAVTVDKNGYVNVLYDDAEYTKFSPNEPGKIRISYPVEL